MSNYWSNEKTLILQYVSEDSQSKSTAKNKNKKSCHWLINYENNKHPGFKSMKSAYTVQNKVTIQLLDVILMLYRLINTSLTSQHTQ